MAIKTSEGNGSGSVFYKINAKEGCFQTGSKAQNTFQKFEPGFTSLDGILTGIKVEEGEYEGVKNESVRVTLKDPEGGPLQFVSVGISNGDRPSAFGIKFLALLNASKIGEPFSITPYFIAKGTKVGDVTYDTDSAGVSMKQGGTKAEHKLKPDYGTADGKLPVCPEVLGQNGKPIMVAGKALKDHAAWSDLLDKQLSTLFGKFAPAEKAEESANPAESAAPSRQAMRSGA